jgi:hypothetical protein
MIRILAITLAASALFLAPAAHADNCTATALFTAQAQTAGGIANYLGSHPDAEAAISTADPGAIRNYFIGHQDQWAALQGAAAPLKTLKQSCPQQVSAGQVASLYDALVS